MIYGSGDKLLREFAEANDRNNLKGRLIKRWFLGSKILDILVSTKQRISSSFGDRDFVLTLGTF
jgi:hypothetical protein